MVKAHRDCCTTSVSEKVAWFKGAMWDGELGFEARMALKTLIEGSLEEEMERQLGGVSHYERSEARTDQRNGHYQRDLVTKHGTVQGVRVPRSRHGTYKPEVFAAYERRTADVDEAICRMFVRGISTRQVGEVLEGLTGSRVSASTVSKVAKALDEQVRRYHQRPLEDHYQYLLLDGVCLRSKGANGPKKVLVLAAYGITTSGHRELIDFCQADGESEAEWTRFLESLYRRGLHGTALRLVTTDGAPGLVAALDMAYPLAPRQRCWVHKLRNVTNKLRKANRDECISHARRIYSAPNRREAVRHFREWKRRWEPLEPRAVACLAADIDTLLRFFDTPPPHRKTVRTTNPIERAFREVRRRTRPMSCFNNPASIERIMFAVVAHLNANWEHKPLTQFTQNT
jgi:putative transposase